MNVRLISVTSGPDEFAPGTGIHIGRRTAEDLIVYCARVSSPQNQHAVETAPRLLRYLVQHKHWSPFEMASMCVEIETSRAISPQILRHRSFTFQEFSQRYAQASEFETYEARRQDDKNRQNSLDDLPIEVRDWFRDAQADTHQTQLLKYERALELGIAKECARVLLPLGTRTRLYMSGTARSWIHYFEARTDPATQLEHREIANAAKAIFEKQFPFTSEALWKA